MAERISPLPPPNEGMAAASPQSGRVKSNIIPANPRIAQKLTVRPPATSIGYKRRLSSYLGFRVGFYSKAWRDSALAFAFASMYSDAGSCKIRKTLTFDNFFCKGSKYKEMYLTMTSLLECVKRVKSLETSTSTLLHHAPSQVAAKLGIFSAKIQISPFWDKTFAQLLRGPSPLVKKKEPKSQRNRTKNITLTLETIISN